MKNELFAVVRCEKYESRDVMGVWPSREEAEAALVVVEANNRFSSFEVVAFELGKVVEFGL
jgi:hypothetical protein